MKNDTNLYIYMYVSVYLYNAYLSMNIYSFFLFILLNLKQGVWQCFCSAIWIPSVWTLLAYLSLHMPSFFPSLTSVFPFIMLFFFSRQDFIICYLLAFNLWYSCLSILSTNGSSIDCISFLNKIIEWTVVDNSVLVSSNTSSL